MEPNRLFPSIPYTKQKGRLGLVGPDHPPFTRYELARIQKMLIAGVARAACPRCGGVFERAVRAPYGASGRDAWVVRCGPCGRGAVIPVHRDPEPTADLFRTLVHSRPGRASRSPWWLARTLGLAAVHIGLFAALSSDRGFVEIAQAALIPDTLYVMVAEPAPIPDLPVLRASSVTVNAPKVPVPPLPDLVRPAPRTESIPPHPHRGPGVTLHQLVDRFPMTAAAPREVAVGGRPYDYDLVDEPPVLVAAGPLRYPRALRSQRLRGAVVVEFVVDSTGTAERESIRIVSTDHEGFNEAATAAVLASVYEPGRVRGRAVRVMVTLTVHFEVAQDP